MKILKKPVYCFVTLVLLTFHFGCKNKSNKSTKTTTVKERTVKIIYTDWSESVAISYLVQAVLENKLDYKTQIKLANIEEVYPQIAEGKDDVFLDAWLPKTHAHYMKKHQNSLVKSGTIFDNAKAGLVIPEYVPISKIKQIGTYVDKIHGIDSTSGIMENTRNAIAKYNLNVQLTNGNEQSMLNFLDDAYKRRKPFVITGWQPHKMFSNYHLKFLEDPDHIFGDAESIVSIANKKKLESDNVLKTFLERFSLNEQKLEALIQEVLSAPGGEKAGAENWIRKNRIIVAEWTKNLHEFEEKSL